jgi:transcriptional regulator with XRE-family HTH domain
MPASAPPASASSRDMLARLGERLRAVRKQQGVSAVAASEAAGISRVTWHRIERGEPSVAMGAWAAAVTSLGLAFDFVDPHAASAPPEVPDHVRLEDYPELKKLAWQLAGVEELTPQEALGLYERNWRHVDAAGLSAKERALIETLSRALGAGRLLV